MIKKFNRACEKLNKKMGVSITLPDPEKKTLKAASMWNFAVGAGLVVAGVVRASKWCAALGGISMISSVVLQRESGSGKDEKKTV